MKLKYYMRGLGIGILMTAIIMSVAYAGRDEMTDEEIKARAKELGMVESMVLSEIGSDQEPLTTSEPEATEAPKVTEPPLETEAPEETEEPTETDDPVETEVPMETDAPVETEVPMETDDPIETKEPIETEAPAETTEPIATEIPQDTEPPAPAEGYITGNTDTPVTEEAASAKGSFQINGDVVTVTIEGGMSSVAVCRLLEDAGLIDSAGSYDRYLCNQKYDKRIRVGVYQIPMGATEEEITQMIVGF